MLHHTRYGGLLQTYPRILCKQVRCLQQEKRKDVLSTGEKRGSSLLNDAGLHIKKTDYTNQSVFRQKRVSELLRALLVLKVSSFETLVKYSEKIFLFGRRFVYDPIFSYAMKKTFYGQFAAGSTLDETQIEVQKLKSAGIKVMLCVPIETRKDTSDDKARQRYDCNKKMILSSIIGEASVEKHGFSQMKLTALCGKPLLVEMNKYLIDHETDHKESPEWDVQRVAELLTSRKYNEVTFSDLSQKFNSELQVLLMDLDDLATSCKINNVRMMIDAEQTYIQAALAWLILVLQAKYNKSNILVYNTYQCYRKDTLSRIEADYNLGVKYGFKIAGKLVRGAYMTEERHLAHEHNYPDPINGSYEETNRQYHACIDYVLPLVNKNEAGFMIATHNEDTIDYLMSRMSHYKLEKNHSLLCFGQIYGMCDHVSFYLGSHGYEVYKSLPYGTIDDTLLYLSRRAHENRSVIQRSIFERFLIRKELQNRIFNIR